MPAVPAVSSLVRFANGLGEDVSAKFPPAGMREGRSSRKERPSRL
jgi:hypothetical protein